MDDLKSDGGGAGLADVSRRDGASLDADYEHCAQVTRRSRSSFYYAFILLPTERRRALHAVYAFCRFIDDIADDETIREPALLLKRWREELDRVYSGAPTRALSRALADSARRFKIPRELFEEIINGVEMDLSRKRYQSWEELRPYCYRVASALGLICIEIFGYSNPSAKLYAENLGLALHELSINAAKHGALSTPAGSVLVHWSTFATDSGDPQFLLSWSEMNGPEVKPPRHKGFGQLVLERMLPRALDGDVRLDFAEGGLKWSITMPGRYIREAQTR